MSLESTLAKSQRRELDQVKLAAEEILRHPLDHRFTDHTIAHKQRIHQHLDVLLADWIKYNRAQNRGRAQAEAFVLLAAVYLHDIGMQMTNLTERPELLKDCPELVAALRDASLIDQDAQPPFSPDVLEFVRKNHHLITYAWLTKVNLKSGRDIFRATGLKSKVQAVARVAWAHNVWIADRNSYTQYEVQLAGFSAQEGDIRLATLAAFLRMGDLLDMDRTRVDIQKLRQFDIPEYSRAHWWRHHFVQTWRLDERTTGRGRPLRIAFSIPEEHQGDADWLGPALHSATVNEIEAEQRRLRKWLDPAGVWVLLPEFDQCEVYIDATGTIEPMPESTKVTFERTWGGPAGEVAQQNVQAELEDANGGLTDTTLGQSIPAMEWLAEIHEYMGFVEREHQQGFRDTPYTPLEIEFDGEFNDALDSLDDLLQRQDDTPRPIVVVGDPGAGKTTLVRKFVLECAKGNRSGQLLPIYLQANRFGDSEWADAIHDRLGSHRTQLTDAEYTEIQSELLNRLEWLMAETVCDLCGVSYGHQEEIRVRLREIMARRTCVVVLDGLNELPAKTRGLAIHAAKQFVHEYRSQRLIITSRVGDYHEDYFPTAYTCSVRPLTETAIRSYWTALQISESAQDRVLETGDTSFRELASNPMYMFMTGQLLKAGGIDAIHGPGRLFQRFTREALKLWYEGESRAFLDADEMQTLLTEVAFRSLLTDSVSFTDDLLCDALKHWWNHFPAASRKRVLAFLEIAIEDDGSEEASQAAQPAFIIAMLGTGLVRRRGTESERTYAFRHHTTHDYFAASAVPQRLEILPELVRQTVFHEPLRLVVDLIDKPGVFVEQLTAATSDGFGRTNLLPLCFRVVGAMPGRLETRVLHQLFSTVLPLLEFTVSLQEPYGAEALGQLFRHVGWEYLAKFLAYAVENDNVPRHTREFAQARIAKTLVQNEPPTAEALTAVLMVDMPELVRADFHAAKQALLDNTTDSLGFQTHPMLLGGLATSISLAPDEKLRICSVVTKLTPHQVRSLDLILLSEQVNFGHLLLFDFGFGEYRKQLYQWYRGCRTELLLQEEDLNLVIGDVSGALDGYFEAWDRLFDKSRLCARLVLFSDEMDPPQRDRLRDLLLTLDGDSLRDSGFSRLRNVLRGRDLQSRFVIHPEIHETILEILQSTDCPWLSFYLDSLLFHHRDHSSGLESRFDELTQTMDWSGRDGLRLLSQIRWIGMFGSELLEKVQRLLEQHFPEHAVPEEKQLVEQLVERQADDDDALVELLMAFGGRTEGYFEAVLTRVFETVDEDRCLSLIDRLEHSDRALSFGARLVFLDHISATRTTADIREYMEQWEIGAKALIWSGGNSGHPDGSAAGMLTLKKLAETTKQDALLAELQWPDRFDSLLKKDTGLDGKCMPAFRLASLVFRLMKGGQGAAAVDVAFKILESRCAPAHLLEKTANESWAYITEGDHFREAAAGDAKQRLVELCFEIASDPRHTLWAVQFIERSVANSDDETRAAVLTRAFERTITALESAIEAEPVDPTVCESPTDVFQESALVVDARAISTVATRIGKRLGSERPQPEGRDLMLPVYKQLVKLLGSWVSATWALRDLERLFDDGCIACEVLIHDLEQVLASPQLRLNYTLRERIVRLYENIYNDQEVPDRFAEFAAAIALDFPAPSPAVAWHYANRGWRAYRVHDVDEFARCTQQALDMTDGDDDLARRCNRAFATFLQGNAEDAKAAYQDAVENAGTKERWRERAIVDLELHHKRWKNADPIDPSFIETVREMAAGLPENQEALKAAAQAAQSETDSATPTQGQPTAMET